MAPILGIYASQISGHLFAPSGAYDSIATSTVGAGGSSSITFSSIPSTYTHLQIRYIDTTSTAYQNLFFICNSDSASNYSAHRLFGIGSGSALADVEQTTYMNMGRSGYDSTSFAAGVVDVLDYANTTKYKTFKTLYGTDGNGAGAIFFSSGNWRSTSAISSITITPASGNFSQYSSFALYGVKGQ
jgi:hypothetical protein